MRQSCAWFWSVYGTYYVITIEIVKITVMADGVALNLETLDILSDLCECFEFCLCKSLI